MAKSIEYTEEIGRKVCEAIATSTLGLKALCKLNPDWPNFKVILKWRYTISSFGDHYARAKQSQIDCMVDRIFELVKDKKSGYLITKKGTKKPDIVYLTKMRCEIDSIKWLASKLAPKIYGDRQGKDNNDNDLISTIRLEDEQKGI